MKAPKLTETIDPDLQIFYLKTLWYKTVDPTDTFGNLFSSNYLSKVNMEDLKSGKFKINLIVAGKHVNQEPNLELTIKIYDKNYSYIHRKSVWGKDPFTTISEKVMFYIKQSIINYFKTR